MKTTPIERQRELSRHASLQKENTNQKQPTRLQKTGNNTRNNRQQAIGYKLTGNKLTGLLTTTTKERTMFGEIVGITGKKGAKKCTGKEKL